MRDLVGNAVPDQVFVRQNSTPNICESKDPCDLRVGIAKANAEWLHVELDVLYLDHLGNVGASGSRHGVQGDPGGRLHAFAGGLALNVLLLVL